VALSGGLELACAVALILPRTRRAGGWATAALLLAVFPANIQMALDGGIRGAGFPMGSPVLAWLRLPLQLPLVLMALAVARERRSSSA
ncbi:MAG: DoxX family protein, partial [Candidatus Dormibacteria bacterium]